MDISPELETQLADNEINFAGNLKFDAIVTGNLEDPQITGRGSLASVTMRGRQLGSLGLMKIIVSTSTIELQDGLLQESDGGNVAFSLIIPQTGQNNISLQAKFNNVDSGNLLAAFPLQQIFTRKASRFRWCRDHQISISSGFPTI